MREAILALQHFAEQSNDDADIHAATKCMTQLQGLIAGHSKDRDAALGMTPAMRTVKRATSGY